MAHFCIHRRPTQEQIEEIITLLRRDLASATSWSVNFAVGIEHRDNWLSGWRESFPTDGRTITIEINGGARETEGEPIR